MTQADGQAAIIAPMGQLDIPQVVAIDQQSFPNPWSANSYRYELTQNQAAHFFVALDPAPAARPSFLGWLLGQAGKRRVIGYVGFWSVVDEIHISTIAVHPRWRGRGIGEQLLQTVLQQALELGAVEVTLEVRVTNTVAQKLYRKYGFEEVGHRPRYYRDGEDALLMTVNLEKARRAKLIVPAGGEVRRGT